MYILQPYEGDLTYIGNRPGGIVLMARLESRKLRDLAAGLMVLSGTTHSAQLWLYPLSGTTVMAAVFGLMFFLLSLGLAGQSRFSLWMGVCLPGVGVINGLQRYLSPQAVEMGVFNIAINLMVLILCAQVLHRTRHMDME